MLQEVFANEKIHERSLEGRISTWAPRRYSAARKEILKDYYLPSWPVDDIKGKERECTPRFLCR